MLSGLRHIFQRSSSQKLLEHSCVSRKLGRAAVSARPSSPKLAKEQAGVKLDQEEISARREDGGKEAPFQTFLKQGARVTRAAHILLNGIAKPGDFVVDATCGNGSDTLWLCQCVGPKGKVLAFDLQTEAIVATRNLLDWELTPEMQPDVSLVQRCHSNLKAELNGVAPKLVCFNLGYLPWTDKSILTLPDTTVAALQAALDSVSPGGAVSVISYVGHEGGQAEHDAVSELLCKLPSRDWTVVTSKILNRPLAPILFIAARK